MPWPLRMISYAAVLLIIIFIYFCIRYVKSVNNIQAKKSLFLKIIPVVLSIIFFAYPVSGWLSYWSSGTFNRTEFPVFFIYTFWHGLVFMGIMLNWLLIHDAALILAKMFPQSEQKKPGKTLATLFLAITAATFCFTAAKMVWDSHRIITRFTELHSNAITEPLTIVHISDLHADIYTNARKLDRYVDIVNRQEPDIVLFGGDLISSGTRFVATGAAALGNIKARYGAFGVLGDHDYWSDTDFIIEQLQENGVTVLLDENHRVNHLENQIRLTGITELYSTTIQQDNLEQLLSESYDDDFKIVLSHQASDRLIAEASRANADLLLGAHTHGGQIRIPLFFYHLTAARAETRFVSGNYLFENLLINVNNGLGYTLAPVRYNASAEVSVIQIYPD